MTLLLVDLDNTLIDRTAAFRRWAHRRLPASDADWLLTVDADGYTPRARVAEAMRERLGLTTPTADLVEELLLGHLPDIEVDPAVPAALVRAAGHGWVPVVVTNGTVRQQELKLRGTGLDRLVAGWVVSEAVGVGKPDPRIFAAAREVAGIADSGGWMVGDHPTADIGGGAAAGLSTAWLHRGRAWPEATFRPTAVAGDFAQAVDLVIASGNTGFAGHRAR
jgi:putative hydrolase of the HAD superfamily